VVIEMNPGFARHVSETETGTHCRVQQRRRQTTEQKIAPVHS
jgi:hypothetical protein